MKLSTMTDDHNSLADSGTREGSTEFSDKYYSSSINVDDFTIKAVIGRGSFGKVYCVVKNDDGKVYAMKTLKKEMILQRD